MAEYTYVVLSNPVDGRTGEFEQWYGGRHLADVVAVDGFTSARLYRLADPAAEGAPPQRYMALYTMTTDDPAAMIDQLRVLVESGRMPMTDAFSQDGLATHLYTPITPLVMPVPDATGRQQP